MQPVVDRIQKLISDNGYSAKYVFTELGMAANSLSDWKRGKGKPSFDALANLSKFFNVSVDYIMFGQTQKEQLRRDEQELLRLYNSLTNDTQHECLGIVKGYTLAHNRDRNKEPADARRNA